MEKKIILEKIKKLLRLSESSNANEAALAFEKVKELMDKYSISQTDIALSEVQEKKSVAYKSKSMPAYKVMLIDTICDHFECVYYLRVSFNGETYKAFPTFIGISPNLEVASYVYDSLSVKQERARAEYYKSLHNNFKKARKLVKADAFAVGWTNSIQGKIQAKFPKKNAPELVKNYLSNIEGLQQSKVRNTHQSGLLKCPETDMFLGHEAGDAESIEHGLASAKTNKNFLES